MTCTLLFFFSLSLIEKILLGICLVQGGVKVPLVGAFSLRAKPPPLLRSGPRLSAAAFRAPARCCCRTLRRLVSPLRAAQPQASFTSRLDWCGGFLSFQRSRLISCRLLLMSNSYIMKVVRPRPTCVCVCMRVPRVASEQTAQ